MMTLIFAISLLAICFIESIALRFATVNQCQLRKLKIPTLARVSTSLSVRPDIDLDYDKLDDDDFDDDDSEGKIPSVFDRVIDDFVMKRYGAGEAWYGKQASKMTDDEIRQKSRASSAGANRKQLRDNAILIVGANEEIGQWITFELSDKGFVVRVSCQDKEQGLKTFGVPGYNVDVLSLRASKSSDKKFARAVQGCQAVVICVNFSPFTSFPLSIKKGKEEFETALKVLDMCVRAREAGVSEIQKILLVSRNLPQPFENSARSRNPLTTLTKNLCDGQIYNEFRELHAQLEALVRATGFDYAIVRAPPQIDLNRKPAEYPLILIEDTKINGNNDVFNRDGMTSSSKEPLYAPRIGILDLSEVITQALIQDVSGITFVVAETESINQTCLNRKDIMATAARIRRKNYYEVLESDESDDETVRMSNLLKTPEAFEAQVNEDVQVENYWIERLNMLQKDTQ